MIISLQVSPRHMNKTRKVPERYRFRLPVVRTITIITEADPDKDLTTEVALNPWIQEDLAEIIPRRSQDQAEVAESHLEDRHQTDQKVCLRDRDLEGAEDVVTDAGHATMIRMTMTKILR